ncbi:MAG: SDR family NAD(P)-dependent oxidoreductase [Desulfobacterales bacterium]|nr:SDR family NAD(P)-dependent oxidoreductase [Desulfobacterales bacterium]
MKRREQQSQANLYDSLEAWTSGNLKNQESKTVLITGAYSGIGYFTALALVKAGAHVLIAGRNSEKLDKAASDIRGVATMGSVETMLVDLASLESIRNFADAFLERHASLDVLINNAGIMMPPESLTEDGFESQFGVNFVGPFALTGLLYSALTRTPGSRVVTLSSIAHRGAHIDFDNLKLEKPYDPRREYYQSKLANIIFALELGRRAETKGDGILSVACHPGFTKTNLQRHVDPAILEKMVFMEAWQGSLPTIIAATGEDVKQGDYYGPDGPKEMGGFPALGVIDNAALNIDVAAKLWELGQEATGVVFP